MTAPTTSTTKLSLFNIRTLPPRTTTSTTTFKPRSLADLFKHRAGQKVEPDYKKSLIDKITKQSTIISMKVEYPEGSEPRTEAPAETTTRARVQATSRRTPQVGLSDVESKIKIIVQGDTEEW